MDQTQLIEKITSEVMKKINVGECTPVSPGTQVVCPPDCTGCYLCVTNNPSGVQTILNGGADRVSSTIGVVNVPADVAQYIDHTLLKPDATQDQFEQLCEEAVQYSFYSVCVNSYWVPFCAKRLRGKGVKVCSVIGFPLGAMDSRSKGFEARNATENGASEIDMVINIGALKSGNHDAVLEDIRSVRRACRATTILKVIIETCLLTDDEKVIACELSKQAGADYMKTSTGFAKGGATAHDIALMRRVVGPSMGVKASGGVRTFEDAKLMIESGATRIGASASVKIVSAKAA
jgi:deoxyribose-phosphate aldolase